MTTNTAATITTDAALLQLIWLASPALPVGGFSYSEGLEPAVEAGHVRDEATAADWIADQLHMTLARADLPVLLRSVTALRANEDVSALDDWVRQTRETSELRQQTEQMGRSLGEWLKSLDAGGHAGPPDDTAEPRRADTSVRREEPLTYPVAFARAASASTASPRDVALAFAFGWAENMMQAAIKAVPLGQGAGQRILLRLSREIPLAVDHALAVPEGEQQSFAPMLAILSAQHETQYSRLFRS
jgi:urease accessory protein